MLSPNILLFRLLNICFHFCWSNLYFAEIILLGNFRYLNDTIPHLIETLTLHATKEKYPNGKCNNYIIYLNQMKKLIIKNMQLNKRIKELFEIIEREGIPVQASQVVWLWFLMFGQMSLSWVIHCYLTCVSK